jgi:hypothetical protein
MENSACALFSICVPAGAMFSQRAEPRGGVAEIQL